MSATRDGFGWRGIYAITEEPENPLPTWLARVQAALEGGVSLIQFRCKSLGPVARRQHAAGLLSLCRQAGVPLIINDDVALCRELQADGVHLGRADTDLSQARQMLGDRAIIGISCNSSIHRAMQAQSDGADYVAFGRFFPSSTKPEAPATSTAILPAARQAVKIPVIAIGGINVDNGASLVAAGADMLAVISSLFGSDDITGNAKALCGLFHSGTG